jgi:pantoate--beta-alanine ligase
MTPHRDSSVRLLRTPEELRLWSERARAAGMVVGLVPTMGALHDGHRSLVRRARAECDRVVVSIFVNPTQFGPGEDLTRYPRPLERDLHVLTEAGADAAFVPAVETMYREGAVTSVKLSGPLADAFEGAQRPGHLDGVATVVTKLLAAARPDRAYFGEKDAQQLAVVTRLAADLDTGVRIVGCPVVRDGDGLALSSRNAYLAAAERAEALAIPAGLGAAAQAWEQGERDAARLVALVRQRLEGSPSLQPEYVAVVDPRSFREVAEAARGCRIVVAARMPSARLIDTLCLGFDAAPLLPKNREKPNEAAARSNQAPGAAEWSRPCSVS